MTISGLDELTKTLGEAQRALGSVDGELGQVSFNPEDPASIEAAIQEVERIVDEKLGAYVANPVIGPIANAMKEQYRKGILEKAAEARVQADTNE